MPASAQTEDTRRFKNDKAAMDALAHTTKLAEVSGEGFDAVFYPGGHGPLWDLAENADSIKLIESMSAGRQDSFGGVPRACRVSPYEVG